VGPEYLDQALVFAAILINVAQLVTAGTEGAARCMGQGADGVVIFMRGIDQILLEGSRDAVSPRQHGTNTVTVFAGCLDDASGTGVDDSGHTTGLGVESVFRRHDDLSLLRSRELRA